MRIRIGGFYRFGTCTQFGAQGHTVVAIARIRGEQFLEDEQKLPEAFLTIAESGTERLIQVASRSMERTAERLAIGREDIAVVRTDARCDIDQIKAGTGGEVQEHFSGWRRHRVSPGCLRRNTLPRFPEVWSRDQGEGSHICDNDHADLSHAVPLRRCCLLYTARRQEYNRTREWGGQERHGKAALVIGRRPRGGDTGPGFPCFRLLHVISNIVRWRVAGIHNALSWRLKRDAPIGWGGK